LGIKIALSTPKPYEPEQHRNRESMAGKFDASALHIQHGINATKLQRNYKSAENGTKIEEFLVSSALLH